MSTDSFQETIDEKTLELKNLLAAAHAYYDKNGVYSHRIDNEIADLRFEIREAERFQAIFAR